MIDSGRESERYIAETAELASLMPRVFLSKAPLFRATTCAEGAFRAVGTKPAAEVLEWIRRAQANLAQARAILEATEHETQNAR